MLQQKTRQSSYQSRVVGITYSRADSVYTIYHRTTEDQVRTTAVRSAPFLIVSDPKLITTGITEAKELQGPHPLRHVAFLENHDAWLQAQQELRARLADDVGKHLWWHNPITSLQFRTGLTFFDQMSFDESKVLSIDIETYTSKGKLFSDANDPDDQIIMISLCDNRGQNWLLRADEAGEANMLRQLVSIIIAEDYDVICGHNILGFDLPYIMKRCELFAIELNIGRDGSGLWQRSRQTRGRNDGWLIAGRSLVDTLQGLLAYDFTARNLPSYQLKEAVVALGLSADRRDFDRSQISALWDERHPSLFSYAHMDAADALKLYCFLHRSSFFLANLLPFNYQEVCNLGTGTKVDSLLVRTYLQAGQSLPPKGSANGALDSGGLTDVYRLGWVPNVAKADAASLYPSICLTYKIAPRSDHYGAFLKTLKQLTQERLNAKRQLKSLPNGSAEHLATDAYQGSLKILINSYYGMLSTTGLHFSDPDAASRITQTGQAVLRKMVADVEDAGGLPVEIDTDGIYFVPPKEYAQDAVSFVAKVLDTGQDAGINIEYEGTYQAMYSYAPKNYLLINNDGKDVLRKGVVFRSRRLYGLQDDFISEATRLIGEGQLVQLADYYRNLQARIITGQLSAEEVATQVSIGQSLGAYAAKLAKGGPRNRAYDLVLTRADKDKWTPRSKIVYYHRRDGNLALTDDYASDYDKSFYQGLLQKTAEKFMHAFPPEVYYLIFSTTDLAKDATLHTWHYDAKSDQQPSYDQKPGQMISFL